MKITQIREEVIHYVYTEKNEECIRYGPNDWKIRMYFDLVSEDYDVTPEDAKKLEELFQVEMELQRLIKEEQVYEHLFKA